VSAAKRDRAAERQRALNRAAGKIPEKAIDDLFRRLQKKYTPKELLDHAINAAIKKIEAGGEIGKEIRIYVMDEKGIHTVDIPADHPKLQQAIHVRRVREAEESQKKLAAALENSERNVKEAGGQIGRHSTAHIHDDLAEKIQAGPVSPSPKQGLLDGIMTGSDRMLDRMREIRVCAQDIKEKLLGPVPEKSSAREAAPPTAGGFLGNLAAFQEEILCFEADVMEILHSILGKL
jgi:hypothetical protein